MVEFIGWIGSIAFALSAIPQAWKSYREGHSSGVSWGLLILSMLGEVCCTVYGLAHNLLPLVLNYVLNFLMLSVIVHYKMRPRHGTT